MEGRVQTKSMVIRVHVQLGGRVEIVIRVNLQFNSFSLSSAAAFLSEASSRLESDHVAYFIDLSRFTTQNWRREETL